MQICEALASAHRSGLIHLDVKPKNILMMAKGIAKLADLGMTRPATIMDRDNAYGTPYYISPEQIRGDADIDARADIYCLGATMYHLMTGRPAFDGDTPTAVMHKHLKQAPIPPDHINTSMTSGVGEIIEVAMAKDREDRYSSTEEMLLDLRAVRSIATRIQG